MKASHVALTFSAVLALLLTILHFLALSFFWYWRMRQFDIFMHFTGGLMVGFLFIFVFFAKNSDTIRSYWHFFLFVIFATLFVGVAWEGFEFIADRIAGRIFLQESMGDTISDLFFDILGSMVAWSIVIFYEKRKRNISSNRIS